MADHNTRIGMTADGRKVHLSDLWHSHTTQCARDEMTLVIADLGEYPDREQILDALQTNNVGVTKLCGHCFPVTTRKAYADLRKAARTAKTEEGEAAGPVVEVTPVTTTAQPGAYEREAITALTDLGCAPPVAHRLISGALTALYTGQNLSIDDLADLPAEYRAAAYTVSSRLHRIAYPCQEYRDLAATDRYAAWAVREAALYTPRAETTEAATGGDRPDCEDTPWDSPFPRPYGWPEPGPVTPDDRARWAALVADWSTPRGRARLEGALQ